MITHRSIAQAYHDLRDKCGGVKEDLFRTPLSGERAQNTPGEGLNQVAFGGNDYGIDGFHFDEQRRNLYLFQFKYSDSHAQFKVSLQRLIENGMERIFAAPNKDQAQNQILTQLGVVFSKIAIIRADLFSFCFYR